MVRTTQSKEPIVALAHWSVYEVPLLGPDFNWTRHFVGYAEDQGLPQVSAAIGTFDPEQGTGVSLSGRVFRLVGESGRHPESAVMWARWKLLSDVTHERDLTSGFHKVMCAWQGSACV
jgi:hypothetical protein